jgi:hypothetical protein
MDIRTFKLITGVELIAELVAPTGNGFRVRKPLQVHFLRGQDGSDQMAFAHWVLTADQDKTVVLFDHLLACQPLETLPEIEDSYIQNTSSIILPPKSNGQVLME